MRIPLIILWLITCSSVAAQQFQQHQALSIPDSLTDISSTAIDLDNDGLLDLALLVKSSGGKSYCMHIKGDTVLPMKLSADVLHIPDPAAYLWTDYDSDNQIDLVLSPANGENAVLFRNVGDFTFEQKLLSLLAFEVVHFTDLDNDGSDDCIWSGKIGNLISTKTFRKTAEEEWMVAHDSLKVRLANVKTMDLNKDGFEDIFLSGTDLMTDSVFSRILLQKRGRFVKAAEVNYLSRGSVVDVDNNGQMDVIVHGFSFKGVPGSFIFQSVGDVVTVAPLQRDHKIADSFWADHNSDGVVDEASLQITAQGDTINSINLQNASPQLLPHSDLHQQVFADLEHDGDLDFIQLTIDGNFTIAYFTNTVAQVNLSPKAPKNGIGLPLYGHLFFYWEKGEDDHTPVNSLTYDFHFETQEVRAGGEFDLVNEKRLTVSHGNKGNVNFALVRNVSAQGLNFAIQSVDNALHAGAGGVCVGSGAGCVEFREEITSACADEQLRLEAAESVFWFSFADGYLGNGAVLDHPVSKDDTVFYLRPDYKGCSEVVAFPIKLNGVVNKLTEELTKCAGSSIALTVPSDWTNVSWESETSGALGSGAGIQTVVNNDDVITAMYVKSPTCSYAKEYRITVSKPVIAVQPASSKIVPGGSVVLSATGAETYSWTPAQGLGDPMSSSTLASPLESTEYVVTAYDSIGCSAEASVIVIVETGDGFVPSLFTPNADGTNDELKVYGLNRVDQFVWRIYNREGNMVFSTRNVTEALTSGWDGTANGIRQPNGVYFWKVEGMLGTRELRLNGRKEGSFLLIR